MTWPQPSHDIVVPGRTGCRRAARWLVREHGWVVVLHPVILLLGLVALLTGGR